MSTTKTLIGGHPELWRGATTAPFLDAIAAGTLPAPAFDRWLEQDHHFVVALLRAWGRLLQSAPTRDFALLVGGMQAFSDELDWFQQMVAQRAQDRQSGVLDLSHPPLPQTQAYNQTLQTLAARPYPEAITAMWAIEEAYLSAWQQIAPGPPAYTAYITHWANPEFAAFVADLARVVDRECPTGPTPPTVHAFVTVAEHEAAFWAMTMQ
ncbi:MAG: TenA family transcriptional regulator [Euzebya sp.]